MDWKFSMNIHEMPEAHLLTDVSPDVFKLPLLDIITGIVQAPDYREAHNKAWKKVSDTLTKQHINCGLGHLYVVRIKEKPVEEGQKFDYPIAHWSPDEIRARTDEILSQKNIDEMDVITAQSLIVKAAQKLTIQESTRWLGLALFVVAAWMGKDQEEK